MNLTKEDMFIMYNMLSRYKDLLINNEISSSDEVGLKSFLLKQSDEIRLKIQHNLFAELFLEEFRK